MCASSVDAIGSQSEKVNHHKTTIGNPTNWKNKTHPQWWRDPGLRRNVFWVAVLYFGLSVQLYFVSLDEWKHSVHIALGRPGLNSIIFPEPHNWLFHSFTWGYSTALLNGLQPLPQFNHYFNKPSGGRLGLIYASQSFPTVMLVPKTFLGSDWILTDISFQTGASNPVVEWHLGEEKDNIYCKLNSGKSQLNLKAIGIETSVFAFFADVGSNSR